jgi:hypothetical protein
MSGWPNAISPQQRPALLEEFFRYAQWTPNTWQRRAAADTHRNLLVVAGRGAGKDEFAAERLLAPRIVEASPGAAVGPTGEVADILFGLCWKQATELGERVESESRWSAQEGHLQLAGGGTIRRRSCDSKSGNVGVRYRDLVWDEVCRSRNGKRIWAQDFRPTLSGFDGQALWITTPAGWDQVHELAERITSEREPDWGYIEAASWDNEYLYPAGRNSPEIVALEREYEQAGVYELFRQEYGAEFTILAGVVFKKWDRKKMVVPHAEAVRDVVEWWLGYDWGWQETHPSVFALVGRTSHGQWRVVGEDYGTGEDPEALLQRGLDFVQRHGLAPQQIKRLAYDPSRPEQGAMFRRKGFNAVPAEYDLAERILATASAIGKPGGLLMSDRCKRIPSEFSVYRHPDHPTIRLEVVKQGDDGVDSVAGVLATAKRMGGSAGLGIVYPRGRRG